MLNLVSTKFCQYWNLTFFNCFYQNWKKIAIKIKQVEMGHTMQKHVLRHMGTPKAQTSLCNWAVWSGPSLSTNRIIGITKTCPYNFYPLKPHFYIVKQGFKGVYIIFLFLLKIIDCGYSLEPPLRGGSNEYPQSMFWTEIWKISEFFIWKFSFFC